MLFRRIHLGLSLIHIFPGGEASFMETMREKMQAAAAVMKERGMVVETYEICLLYTSRCV